LIANPPRHGYWATSNKKSRLLWTAICLPHFVRSWKRRFWTRIMISVDYHVMYSLQTALTSTSDLPRCPAGGEAISIRFLLVPWRLTCTIACHAPEVGCSARNHWKILLPLQFKARTMHLPQICHVMWKLPWIVLTWSYFVFGKLMIIAYLDLPKFALSYLHNHR
jgi:hypothetical protein